MLNEKLLYQVARMLYQRAKYCEKYGNHERSVAYLSAHDMLLYALDGNKEAVDQFDYYGEEE